MFEIYDAVNGNNSFSAYEIYQLDSKIDDGLPASGDVRDDEGSPCTTSGGSKYNLSSATKSEALKCLGFEVLF